MTQELEHLSYEERLRELGLFRGQAGEEKVVGRPYKSHSVAEGGL